ncbi:hypothetical protein K2173_024015 [Erythroxylum novogranatense]|uniref:Uncharacterized protein n=1 Tax=Erythroxylum novogranatense TaxID=1862640 RepID=A0AAV8TT14_9ROSI|nr:hypothetical protein K2173_024015 [Erythroxylum novogranatense]
MEIIINRRRGEEKWRQFFEVQIDSARESFRQLSNAHDEEELLWEAILRLPTQKQGNFTLLTKGSSPHGGGDESKTETVDVRRLDRVNRELVVKKALATNAQDNSKLLSAVRDRFGRLHGFMKDLVNLEKERKIRPSREIDAFKKASVVGSRRHSIFKTCCPRMDVNPSIYFQDVPGCIYWFRGVHNLIANKDTCHGRGRRQTLIPPVSFTG